MDDEEKLIDPVLVERFANGNGTIFVGSGISSSAGMPLWGELMDPLRTDLCAEIHERASYLEIAELYETKYSRSDLVRYLKNSLAKPGFQLTKAHELLVSLPVKRIYTTNFDDLLEQASSRQGIRHHVISDATQVAFADTSTLSIIKLHGDLNHEAALVIGSGDFYSYFTKNPSVADLLKVELQTHTILFLGYSFSDVNLNMILGKAADHSGSVRPLLYALQLEPKPLATLALDRRGVKVIGIKAKPGSLEAHEQIESWLRRFKKQLMQHERRGNHTAGAAWPRYTHSTFPRRVLSKVRADMHQKFDDGIHSDFRVIIVKGEPGIGKSHLLGSVMQQDANNGPRNGAGDAFEKIVWLRPSTEPDVPAYTLERIFSEIANALDSFGLASAEKKFSKSHAIDRMIQEHKVLIVIEDLELGGTAADLKEAARIKKWLQNSGPFARPASRIVVTSRTLLLPGFVIELQRLEKAESTIMLDELSRQIMLRRTFPHVPDSLKNAIVACTFGNPQAMRMALGLVHGVGGEHAEAAVRDLAILIRRGAHLPVTDDPASWKLEPLPEYFCTHIAPVFQAINTMVLRALAGLWQATLSPSLAEADVKAQFAASIDGLPAAFNVLKALLVFPDAHAIPSELLQETAAISSLDEFTSASQQCVKFGLLEYDTQTNAYWLDRITRSQLLQLSKDVETKNYQLRLADHLLRFLRQNHVICRDEIGEPYWNALVRAEMAKVDPYWPIIKHVIRQLKHSPRTVDFVELLVHYMDSRFMHTERKEFLHCAVKTLEDQCPGSEAKRALLKIDALAWTYMEEGDFVGANRVVEEGRELLSKSDHELNAIALTWKARIACSSSLAANGEPSRFIEDAKKNFERSLAKPAWIEMRIEMIEGDVLLPLFPEKALKHYRNAESLAESYGGEGDGYQTGPRIGVALLKMWDETTAEWRKLRASWADVEHNTGFQEAWLDQKATRDGLLRDAEYQFRKLLRNESVAAARLHGKYGLALISARKNAGREAIIQLKSIHQEISERNKNNILLKLAEDLYSQTVTNSGTSSIR